MCGNERFNVSLVTCTILFYACGSWLSTRICSYYFDARKLILVSYIVYIRFAEAFHTRLLPGFRGKLVLETRNFLPGYVKSNLIIKVVIPKHSHGYVIPESRAFYFVYHPAKLFIRNDLVNNLLVEFINIFDKGYRCIVWQPRYSRRAEVFTALLCCSKRSNIQWFADLWLLRGFQVNFMYDPLH